MTFKIFDSDEIAQQIRDGNIRFAKQYSDTQRSVWKLGSITKQLILVPNAERDNTKMYYVHQGTDDSSDYKETTVANSGRIALPRTNDLNALGAYVWCGYPPDSEVFSILEWASHDDYAARGGFTVGQIELALAAMGTASGWEEFKLTAVSGQLKYSVSGFWYQDKDTIGYRAAYTRPGTLTSIMPTSGKSKYVTIWYDLDTDTYYEAEGTEQTTLTYPDDINLDKPSGVTTGKVAGIIELTNGASAITRVINVLPVVDFTDEVNADTSGGASGKIDPATCNTRISVSSSDFFGEGQSNSDIYVHHFGGDKIALYDATEFKWKQYDLPNDIGQNYFSIDVSGLTASRMYDVVCYLLNGAVAIEVVNVGTENRSTTQERDRGNVLFTQGKRYLGSFYVDASGYVVDTVYERNLYNQYNRTQRDILIQESTATWTYNSTTKRYLNNDSSNRVTVLCPTDESVLVQMKYTGLAVDSSGTPGALVGFTETTSGLIQDDSETILAKLSSIVGQPISATYSEFHTDKLLQLSLFERIVGTGTVTFYGVDATSENNLGATGSVII